MIDFEKMIEAVAKAIWQADSRKGAEWEELLLLASQDGYMAAKRLRNKRNRE